MHRDHRMPVLSSNRGNRATIGALPLSVRLPNSDCNSPSPPLRTSVALQDAAPGLHEQLASHTYHLDLTIIYPPAEMTNAIPTFHKLRLGLTCLSIALNAWALSSPLSDYIFTMTPSEYARVACSLSL